MTPHLLAAVLARRARHMAASRLRERLLIADAARGLELLLGDGISGQPPLQPDLPALWKRLDAAEKSGNYDAITSKDWRDSPWCFWHKEGDAVPLVKRPTFTRRYGAWIEARQRKSDYRRLIQALLLHFTPENPPRSAAALVIDACTKWPEWLWAQRHLAHDMFDVEKGPVNLASQVLDDTRPVREVLSDHGLGEWLQTGGYAEAAFAAMLSDVPRRLRIGVNEARSLDLVRRTLEWSESSSGDLQFANRRTQLAEALLLPWAQTTPTKAVEQTITPFLLKTFGDPRMSEIRWNGVDDSAVNVFKRWLTGATLEAFIRVIERVAEKDHWKYRQAFWMAYYRAGHVRDAWVALGPEAKIISRRFVDLSNQSAELVRPPLSNHSVLMLRIANLVVADWSHNGKCRIWLQNDQRAPALYRPRYEISDLRGASDFEVTHHGSSTGHWQRRIHDHIRDLTSIGLYSSKYMP